MEPTLNNDVLKQHYRDFLLQYMDINWPMRRKLTEESRLDFALEHTFFKGCSYPLLEHFEINWITAEALIAVIKYGVWDKLNKHPFVQECIRLHRAIFEELTADE